MGGSATMLAPAGTRIGPDDVTGDYEVALGHLVAFFRAKGISLDDSRDMANETILRTLVHLRRHGRTRSDLGPLARTIARNLLVERVRRATIPSVPLSDGIDIPDETADPVETIVADERAAAVREAVRSLHPRHRRVVELWMQGRNPAEIARDLGIKRNAADAILHRARRSLASRLGPRALWGLLGLAFLRAKLAAREAGMSLAAWSPGSASAVPAGVSLATVSLVAVLSITSPTSAQPAPIERSPAAPAPARVSVVDAPALTGGKAVAPTVADPEAPRPASDVRSPAYEVSTGAEVNNPTTGEPDDAGIDISYDPDENGRGPVDDLLEPAVSRLGGR